MTKVTNIFIDLGYPDDVVRRIIKRTANTSAKPSESDQNKKKFVYLRLPYIGPVAEIFRQQLSKAVSQCFDEVKLRTIFTTRTLFNGPPKDRTPTLHLRNVVYKFKCSCDSMYVGRTSQRFHSRIKEHVPKSLKEAFKSNKDVIDVILKSNGEPYITKLTSIGQHLKDNPKCGRDFDIERFSVVKRARNDFHLKVLEAIYIKCWQPNLCVQKENVYNTILYKTPF